MVVEELDVAVAEFHVQGQLLGEIAEGVHGLDLGRGELGDAGQGLRLADRGADAAHTEIAPMKAEHRHAEPRLLAGRDFADARPVEVRRQLLRQIGAAFEHFVVKGDRAHDAAGAAGLRRTQAQQRDDVARVGMEPHHRAGLVTAHQGIIVILAQILDVTQQVPVGVLRHRAAEIEADAPQRGPRLGGVVFGDGKAADEDVTPPFQKLVTDVGQHRGEGGQREVVAPDVLDVEAQRLDPRDGRADLGDLLRGQVIDPLFRVQRLRGRPTGGVDHRCQLHRRLPRNFRARPCVARHGLFPPYPQRIRGLSHIPARLHRSPPDRVRAPERPGAACGRLGRSGRLDRPQGDHVISI